MSALQACSHLQVQSDQHVAANLPAGRKGSRLQDVTAAESKPAVIRAVPMGFACRPLADLLDHDIHAKNAAIGCASGRAVLRCRMIGET